MKNVISVGVFCLFMLGVSGCGRSIEIIGHRGASYLAPENTLASVKLAWQKRADAEVDVYLSRDGRIVVIHDGTTKRTAGVDLKVSQTDWQDLHALDVGSLKGPEFTGERIPLLADVLATIPRGQKLFIEIKCGREILPPLKRIIDDSGKISQIVIIGFDLEVVAASKQLIDVPTYWLKGTEKIKDTDEWIPHDPALAQTAKERGLDGLDVHYAGVTADLVRAAKARGQKLYVWTVDDPNEAARLVALGVDGITTNRPEWLRDQLKNHRQLGK